MKPNEQQAPDKLTEIRRARELGILPWSHLSNPTRRFEIARDTIDYLLSLLQQQPTGAPSRSVNIVDLQAWMTINAWLRQNPNATVAECLAELSQRITKEVATTGAG